MSNVSRETSDIDEQIDQLAKGCMALGLDLKEDVKETFLFYLKEIIRWNRRVNLISRQDTHNIAAVHFLDSLSLLAYIKIPMEARIIDVGTGAGFPGLPLKIYRPDIFLTLIESKRKKSLFLHHIVDSLRLTKVSVLNKRAEDINTEDTFRGQHDIALARAVSHLKSLLPLSLPFLKPGGMFIAYKGGSIEKELMETIPELLSFGARLERKEPVLLPTPRKRRQLIVIKKLNNEEL